MFCDHNQAALAFYDSLGYEPHGSLVAKRCTGA